MIRTSLILGLAALCCSTSFAQQRTYTFQGPNFTDITGGTLFTTDDSITGTIVIDGAVPGGSCSGFGDGPGQCDVQSLEMSAGPLTVAFSGSAGFADAISLEFDADANITEFNIANVAFPSFISYTVRSANLGTIPDSTQFNDPNGGNFAETSGLTTVGVWTQVPEPTTALLTLAMFGATLTAPRRRSSASC